LRVRPDPFALPADAAAFDWHFDRLSAVADVGHGFQHPSNNLQSCLTLRIMMWLLHSADADGLAFLAVWKRVIAKRSQAASEAEGLRQATSKMKRSLMYSEQEANLLHNRIDGETSGRAAAEQQLKELQAKHVELQEDLKKQHEVSCSAMRVCGHVDAMT
jgi:hypothetical protein